MCNVPNFHQDTLVIVSLMLQMKLDVYSPSWEGMLYCLSDELNKTALIRTENFCCSKSPDCMQAVSAEKLQDVECVQQFVSAVG